MPSGEFSNKMWERLQAKEAEKQNEWLKMQNELMAKNRQKAKIVLACGLGLIALAICMWGQPVFALFFCGLVGAIWGVSHIITNTP